MRCLTESQATFCTAYSGDIAWVLFTEKYNKRKVLNFIILKYKIHRERIHQGHTTRELGSAQCCSYKCHFPKQAAGPKAGSGDAANTE